MFVVTLCAYMEKNKGFGDGLKSGAASLMANSSKVNKLLQFECRTRDHIISWNFKGRPLEGIRLCILFATFNSLSMCSYVYLAIGSVLDRKVLEVEISHRPNPDGEKEHTLIQTICSEGVGRLFLDNVVSRFQVFWPLPPDEGNSNSNLSSAALEKAPPAAVDDSWKELTPDLKSVSGCLQHGAKADGGRWIWHAGMFRFCMQSKLLTVKNISSKKTIDEFTVNSARR
jgi:hypothetical protein